MQESGKTGAKPAWEMYTSVYVIRMSGSSGPYNIINMMIMIMIIIAIIVIIRKHTDRVLHKRSFHCKKRQEKAKGFFSLLFLTDWFLLLSACMICQVDFNLCSLGFSSKKKKYFTFLAYVCTPQKKTEERRLSRNASVLQRIRCCWHL